MRESPLPLLTADRSTTELRWNLLGAVKGVYLASEAATGKCFARQYAVPISPLQAARNRP